MILLYFLNWCARVRGRRTGSIELCQSYLEVDARPIQKTIGFSKYSPDFVQALTRLALVVADRKAFTDEAIRISIAHGKSPIPIMMTRVHGIATHLIRMMDLEIDSLPLSDNEPQWVLDMEREKAQLTLKEFDLLYPALENFAQYDQELGLHFAAPYARALKTKINSYPESDLKRSIYREKMEPKLDRLIEMDPILIN